MSDAPFIIFGLTRSRTYWLSRFLSYGDWTCGHEEARHVRTLRDVKSWLSQNQAGTVETAISGYWRLILSLRPDIRVAVVRRPVAEVVQSLIAAGNVSDEPTLKERMTKFDKKLDQIAARIPNCLSVDFADLNKESTCAKIFEHCLPYRHDRVWWAEMARQNLQINLPALMRYEAAFIGQMRIARSICDQESRAILWRARKVPDLDGMTFQEESFSNFWIDGQKLFAQHCVEVDDPSTEYFKKNLPLMDRLDQMGMFQVMTARCNGRMFGYLLSVLGPSLEDANPMVATQTALFASRDAPGLGMRLQRASLRALEDRGGKWTVVQRAGVRGAGSRLSAMYRRMGSEDYGQLYKLSIGSA